MKTKVTIDGVDIELDGETADRQKRMAQAEKVRESFIDSGVLGSIKEKILVPPVVVAYHHANPHRNTDIKVMLLSRNIQELIHCLGFTQLFDDSGTMFMDFIQEGKLHSADYQVRTTFQGQRVQIVVQCKGFGLFKSGGYKLKRGYVNEVYGFLSRESNRHDCMRKRHGYVNIFEKEFTTQDIIDFLEEKN